jgi:LPS sulfotransferase NodH
VRKPGFLKDPEGESYFETVNRTLQTVEEGLYAVDSPEYPFIFIVGLPRSGTTLLSQLIAGGLDIGYVNNLVARFWLSPVTGIKLSQAVFGAKRVATFHSTYGATQDPLDVHEFGYFWRHWLQKRTFEDVRDAHLSEDNIDWTGLRRVLANMQSQFDAPMVFKNIFGSYHIERMHNELKNVLYIYIERDPLDVAISILKARQKYYSDINCWWSYVPPDYEKVIHKDYWTQIAGQVHYLKRYYNRAFSAFAVPNRVLRVKFAELCSDPRGVVGRVNETLTSEFGESRQLLDGIPATFPFRTYAELANERARFADLLDKFECNDP